MPHPVRCRTTSSPRCRGTSRRCWVHRYRNERCRVAMSQPNVPEAGAPAVQETELRTLVFSDADSAKKWANSLPLTSVALVCETVQGQLKALSAALFPARE